MELELPRLVCSESGLKHIQTIVAEMPEGLETGVTLFGTRQDGCRVALFAVGPGPRAIHTPGFHQPDCDYINQEFERLRQSLPGLAWIGSLHVHLFGMTWLSGHDRKTLKNLFELETLQLPDFVAGIMQRCGKRLAIYPYLLTQGEFLPWLMPLEIVLEECPAWRSAMESAARVADKTTAVAPGSGQVDSFPVVIWRRLAEASGRLKNKVHTCAAKLKILRHNRSTSRKEDL
jgi:hypothetical protein